MLKNYFSIFIFCYAGIVSSQSSRNSEAVPIVSISPAYPLKALINHLEGSATILMHITEQGTVDKVDVIKSSPDDIFDATSVDAGMKFKFMPKFVEGTAATTQATITMEYKLPDQKFEPADNELFELMRAELVEIPYFTAPVVLAESVKIKSKIKPKNVQAVHLFFNDDKLLLSPEPVMWKSQEALVKTIPDYAEQLNQRVSLVQKQYEMRPGLFKRFHKIYTAKNHPPELLNSIDSVDTLNTDNQSVKTFQITVNEEGKVSKWKSLSNKEDNKNPYIRESINRLMSSLSFKPALKNGQPISDSIKIEFKTKSFTQFEVMAIAFEQNKHHARNQPWVKLVALIDKKGRVEDLKVVDSADDAFNEMALQKFSRMKFRNKGKIWHMTDVVEFEPQVQ